MSTLPLIAIDGPSGVGKSTTAKLIAKKLKWNYLDTGAMYRATALAIKRAGIVSIENSLELDSILSDLNINQIANRTFLDSEDISEAIRTSEITKMSSLISANARVRETLVNQQRRIVKAGGWVIDGRDIGTVVCPNACCKIYLVANIQTRAWRRFQEIQANGITTSLHEVAEDINSRDLFDSTRALSPLCKAVDAIELDSSNMSLVDVVDWIIAHHLKHA